MMQLRSSCRFLLLVLGLSALATPRAAGAAPDEVKTLIAQLGDHRFPRRVAAHRRLCELGPAALDDLEVAAKTGKGEVAIRARSIVATLSRQLLAGVRVTLEGPAKPLGWDEPAALTVVFENTSDRPARIPLFPAATDPARTDPVALAAAQLVDLADYLTVTRPDGEPIALHVDDIRQIEPLQEAINLRIDSDDMTVLPAGETFRVSLRSLNRGWARYRMLHAGRYFVQLDYAPDWDDPELRRKQVGHVASNRLAIAIARPAPPAVRRSSRPLAGELTRDGDDLVVSLVCTADVPVHVNTRIGSRIGRTAAISWTARAESGSETVKPAIHTEPAPAEMSDKKALRRLTPGQRIIVARLPIAALLEDRAIQALKPGESFSIRARYANQFSRAFVLTAPTNLGFAVVPKGKTAKAYAATLPAHIPTGSVTTNEIKLTRP